MVLVGYLDQVVLRRSKKAHVFTAGVSKELGCERSCGDSFQLAHHVDVILDRVWLAGELKV